GVKVTFPREPPHYRALLNFAIPAFLSTLMVTPVLWFSSTLLATSASFVALGQYSVANGLAGYLLLVSASIGIPLVPIVARLNREDPGQVSPFLIKTLRITTFLSLPPAVVLVSLPSPFLSLLYGSQYMTAAPLVAGLGPAGRNCRDRPHWLRLRLCPGETLEPRCPFCRSGHAPNRRVLCTIAQRTCSSCWTSEESVQLDRSVALNTQSHFDNIADAYYRIVDRIWYDIGYFHRRERDFLRAQLLGPVNLAVDAGCGPGRHLPTLMER